MIKDEDKVWKTVKGIRLLYISNITLRHCMQNQHTLLTHKEIQTNFLTMMRELKLEESTVNIRPVMNVSRSYINTAGNMFTYLNYCPPLIFRFYKGLFRNATTREMVVAMSNLIKTSKGTEKKIALKIWHKLMEHLENGSTYRKIEQIIGKERKHFGSSLNTTLAVDILG